MPGTRKPAAVVYASGPSTSTDFLEESLEGTDMPTLSSQAQTIVASFGQQPGVAQDHRNNLQAALNASPALIDQINDAVAQGHLKQIVPLTNPNAGGEYDPQDQAMRLPLAKLTTPPAGPGSNKIAQENAGEITFVLGHELQHGFNRAVTRQAYTDFANDVRQIAKDDPAPRDYTAPTGVLLAQNRRDEATAEIAGWNAVVSRVKATNSNPSLQDIYEAQPSRMKDFIDVAGNNYTLKSNLALNADLSLSTTPANVEAMGHNYFDKAPRSPGGLGALGNSDYVNYYGRSPVSFIAQTERHYNPPQAGVSTPQMGLNLSRLRLSEKLLEENGIDLGNHQQPVPYYDLSNQPPAAHLFQHTKTTHQHVSPIAAEVLDSELSREPAQPTPSRRPPDFDHSHPDHDLLEKLRDGVRKLDQEAGKGWDDASERLAASTLVMAKEKGFTAQDELQLAFNKPSQRYAAGELLHLSRQGPGESSDPAANRSHMTTAEALSKEVAERYQELEAINITQERTQLLQPTQQINPDDPTRGPVMRM
jgi:hypothetical protein